MVNNAVLTYHFQDDSSDSLYVCLDIPTVKETHERIRLPSEVVQQIPSEIMKSIEHICSEYQISLEIRDYKLAIETTKANKESQGEPYYRGAPVEEILRFASTGTKLAVQILDSIETGERPWVLDAELARFILLRLKESLGEDYLWLPEAWHFVCNPLLLRDSYMWILADADTCR